MSATDLFPAQPTPATASAPPRRSKGRSLNFSAWARVVVACAILLGSAGVRAWQARRIESALAIGRARPRFDLRKVATTLGRWKGQESTIDPQIVRGTGADQIVTRRYVNQDTGVNVDLILLYGPAAEVYLHSPEVCYPSAGYTLIAGPDDRSIPTSSSSSSSKAPFRSMVYTKGEAGQAERQEVYYTWWYNGRWNPEIGKQKHFERIPGMYKVHLARRVVADEKRDVGNPCESLLEWLLPEIEGRMASAPSPTP